MIDHFAKRASSTWASRPVKTSSSPRSTSILLGASVALFLLIGVAGYRLGRSSHQSPLRETPEVLAEALVGPNRISLADQNNGPLWLTLYREYQDLLGEPLAPEQPIGACPHAIIFANYVICHSSELAVKGSQWEYPPMVLGLEHLPQGVARNIDAPLAPIVNDYINSVLRAKGRDWLYWTGRSISLPYCNSSGECFQAFERQVLRWPNSEFAGPSDVKLSPLGLNVMNH